MTWMHLSCIHFKCKAFWKAYCVSGVVFYPQSIPASLERPIRVMYGNQQQKNTRFRRLHNNNMVNRVYIKDSGEKKGKIVTQMAADVGELLHVPWIIESVAYNYYSRDAVVLYTTLVYKSYSKTV